MWKGGLHVFLLVFFFLFPLAALQATRCLRLLTERLPGKASERTLDEDQRETQRLALLSLSLSLSLPTGERKDRDPPVPGSPPPHSLAKSEKARRPRPTNGYSVPALPNESGLYRVLLAPAGQVPTRKKRKKAPTPQLCTWVPGARANSISKQAKEKFGWNIRRVLRHASPCYRYTYQDAVTYSVRDLFFYFNCSSFFLAAPPCLEIARVPGYIRR